MAIQPLSPIMQYHSMLIGLWYYLLWRKPIETCIQFPLLRFTSYHTNTTYIVHSTTVGERLIWRRRVS
jgi:hypothetical protein